MITGLPWLPWLPWLPAMDSQVEAIVPVKDKLE